MKLLVTGGAGFIGSHFVRYWLKKHSADRVTTLDKLTYAGTLENLADVLTSSRHRFVRGDIGDGRTVKRVLAGVDSVVHFAAETHVDRSLLDANPFLQTNVQGTYTLVHAAREAGVRRFLHVSTDEVYGSVGKGKSRETALLNPTSPYAASKAASDLVVLSQWLTYRYPVLVTRCTNNYGPQQHPEKFLPLFITNALEGVPLPLYGRGLNVRNWIHVLDHCEALDRVLKQGRPGGIYNIAGAREYKNIDVARKILNELGRPGDLLNFVKDREGHDQRYAPDTQKIFRELGWRPKRSFEEGLVEMLDWYRTNERWWRAIRGKKGGFKNYYKKQYATRLKTARA
ncbi:MAG: dTDP-glucose 4,6-dehydratase [Elusimicrobia bacterium]|jgi:dTDP-glucose 4,6-dehydratase|nr:dTDP-glucose 4,6-dehydratase [Elusimicrobiota bacterium]